MQRQKSVMTHQFSQVPKAEIPRSSFDRSHGYKTTFDSGFLVPIFIDEALPGDTFNLSMTGLARLATPIFPVMDNMRMETFFFSVPIRLIWDNWQKFNGEQDSPDDSTDFVIPTLTSPVGGFLNESLEDYMGIPTLVPGLEFSSLWHRAYNLIFNQWFRDQNLIDSLPVPKGDGPDTLSDFFLLRRGKRHDYFTSALPFPQKGDAVSIPLGTSAPVEGMGAQVAGGTAPLTSQLVSENDSATTYDFATEVAVATQTAPVYIEWSGATGSPLLTANLTDATAVTINTLRQGFQIQKLLERDARGGTRYTEIIRAHFGVSSPDSRLQRPEYLGGGSSPINIQPVAQTQATDPATLTPQANLAAIGTATLNGHGFTKSFTEHCVLIGLVNVRADLTYQEGLNRMFSRATRFDFYWPALSHIGEQTILAQELVAVGDTVPGQDQETWAYQERYAEYRYKPSQITGKFRSNDPQSLDAWHLAQDFAGTLPPLSEPFISEVPPIDRIIAVPTEPQFLLDTYFQLRCARPMPLYGVPGMIDHF